MAHSKSALIVVENNYVPLDTRVWYEASSLRDAGWKVTVICPAPPDTEPNAQGSARRDEPVDLDGVKVFYFRVKAAEQGVRAYLVEYIAAFLAIARLLWYVRQQQRFDVLHICNPPDIFFPLALLYRLLGVRIIFDHHDLFPEFVSHRFHGIAAKLFYRLALVMEFLTYQCADVTISVNESYRNIALRRGRVPSQKNVIVRNGPKAREFAPPAAPGGFSNGFPISVCYLGIMGYEDGISELMAAIRHIVRDLGRQDIFFYLIGDGSLRRWALEQISAWGLEHFVDMPGLVRDREAIKQYLSAADICLAPEPLSPLNANSTFIKVGEYMAMGKPLVAFDLPETRWTAQDAAVYVPHGDIEGFACAISELANHPEQRATMGAFARKRFLDCLSWEHQEASLLKAYQMALGKHSEAASE